MPDSDSESNSTQLPSLAGPTVTQTTPSARRSYIAWIALFIALLSLGVSGTLYYLQAQPSVRMGSGITSQVQQLSRQLQQLTTQVQQQTPQVAATTTTTTQHTHPLNTSVQQQLQQQQHMQQQQANNLSQQQLQMTQQAAELHNVQQQLQQQTQQLEQISQRHHNMRRPWLIGQAEYLVQLAQLQLIYGQHVQTALQLLQSASQNLATLADAGLYDVRKQLHHDMQILQQTTPLDEGALVAQINALAQQVLSANLKIKQQFHAQAIKNQNVHAPQDLTKNPRSYITHGFSAMIAGFKNLVVVRPIGAAPPQILSQQQILYIKENIALKLTQAEWAVLQHNQQLYVMNLQRASNMLQHLQKIQITAASRQLLSHLQSQLQLLQSQVVELKLPKLYASLAALRALSLGANQDAQTTVPPASVLPLKKTPPKKHNKKSNNKAQQETAVTQASSQVVQPLAAASQLPKQALVKHVIIVAPAHAVYPAHPHRRDPMTAVARDGHLAQGATHESIH